MKKTSSLILLLSTIFSFSFAQPKKAVPAAQQKMDIFITNLMSKMKIDEKIGQLNLPVVSGDIVTGQANSSNTSKQIQAGQVGGLFNIKGLAKIRAAQEIA